MSGTENASLLRAYERSPGPLGDSATAHDDVAQSAVRVGVLAGVGRDESRHGVGVPPLAVASSFAPQHDERTCGLPALTQTIRFPEAGVVSGRKGGSDMGCAGVRAKAHGCLSTCMNRARANTQAGLSGGRGSGQYLLESSRQ